jgi:zinc transport system ATP-binding protein
MSVPAAIEFKNVGFAYNGIPALENASLELAAKDFACIIGPNGGGKTTLLKLVLGLLEPLTGEVRVFGERAETVRNRIGYVPQFTRHDPLFPVTVKDVVLMGSGGGGLGGFYRRSAHQQAERVLHEVELQDLADRPYAQLSGGQQQRVLIARALCSEPDLLLLDEATANIDANSADVFLALLKRLNERITILMVSHDLDLVSKGVRTVVCVNRSIRIHATTELTGEHIQALYHASVCLVHHDHDEPGRR